MDLNDLLLFFLDGTKPRLEFEFELLRFFGWPNYDTPMNEFLFYGFGFEFLFVSWIDKFDEFDFKAFLLEERLLGIKLLACVTLPLLLVLFGESRSRITYTLRDAIKIYFISIHF